jgi:uncharacterized membrane-anchored protein
MLDSAAASAALAHSDSAHPARASRLVSSRAQPEASISGVLGAASTSLQELALILWQGDSCGQQAALGARSPRAGQHRPDRSAASPESRDGRIVPRWQRGATLNSG